MALDEDVVVYKPIQDLLSQTATHHKLEADQKGEATHLFAILKHLLQEEKEEADKWGGLEYFVMNFHEHVAVHKSIQEPHLETATHKEEVAAYA